MNKWAQAIKLLLRMIWSYNLQPNPAYRTSHKVIMDPAYESYTSK